MLCGVAGGVQSCSESSKTRGNRSSSEIYEFTDAPSADSDERLERRGQEGYAHEGDCERELGAGGMTMGDDA